MDEIEDLDLRAVERQGALQNRQQVFRRQRFGGALETEFGAAA